MNPLDLSSKATRFRKELGEDATSPIDIFALALTIENLQMWVGMLACFLLQPLLNFAEGKQTGLRTKKIAFRMRAAGNVKAIIGLYHAGFASFVFSILA